MKHHHSVEWQMDHLEVDDQHASNKQKEEDSNNDIASRVLEVSREYLSE